MEEARRRSLCRSNHLEAVFLQPRPGNLCLPRVNGDEALLGSTVICRRGSLLMRIPTTSCRVSRPPTTSSWKRISAVWRRVQDNLDLPPTVADFECAADWTISAVRYNFSARRLICRLIRLYTFEPASCQPSFTGDRLIGYPFEKFLEIANATIGVRRYIARRW